MPLVMLDEPISVAETDSGTWVDVNLADYVTLPAAGVSGVILYASSAYGYDVGARKNGSTDTYIGERGTSGETGRYQIWCGVDSAATFEVYSENISNTTIKIAGYTTDGFTFFDNGIPMTGATTLNTWTDLDCSSYVPSNAIGLIFSYHSTAAGTGHIGLRQNGSTDDIYGHAIGTSPVTVVMGCTTGVVEYYIGSTATHIVLMGYITDDSGATFYSDKAANNYSIGTGGWKDLTALPTNSIAGLFEIQCTDSVGDVGLRKNGTTSDAWGGLGYGSCAVGCDASFLVEGEVSTTTLDFYLTAYFIQPPTNPKGGGVGIGDCMIF